MREVPPSSVARRIHENRSHDVGRNSEEIRPVPGVRLLVIDEPKVGFVQQFRGL